VSRSYTGDVAPKPEKNQHGIDDRETRSEVFAHQAAYQTGWREHVIKSKGKLLNRMRRLGQDEQQKG